MTLTYGEAKDLMSKARSESRGRPLQNNTRLYKRTPYGGGREYYAVQLHRTDVVEIHQGNRYVLNTGGWDTVTTWDRIGSWGPTSWQTIKSDKGTKYARLRPNPEDPQPNYPSRTVLKPYAVEDPGPEPVKSDEGCWIGQRHVKTTSRRDFVKPERATARELETYEGPSTYRTYRRRHGESGVRSRDLVHYLKGVEIDLESYAGLYLITQTTEVVEYIEQATYWSRRESGPERVSCPHCEEFRHRHGQWNLAMNGGWRAGHGYATMVENLERYGSHEAWMTAWKEDGREVRAGQAEWREWDERNRLMFRDGMQFDADGYVTKGCARKMGAELRRQDREERRRQHKAEQERKRIKRTIKRIKDGQATLEDVREDTWEWLARYGVDVHDDIAVLYKATGPSGVSGHGAKYEVGKWTVADDYTVNVGCGHGLHFGPEAEVAAKYDGMVRRGEGGTEFYEVHVPLVSIIAVGDKCKAERCFVARQIKTSPHGDE